ncbi:two-component system QseEF-associated lipoprotein QseG [Xenorhabdus szentirmaii]|uniref:two-component system QseEF-associated lipoprotein QseG n=2 Tax=Xenorhabdus szentirmaii TaxID=290112 RepID=UPI00210053F9|nr:MULTISPECIES: two-component system QseEF-associated lipoprotein QseG [Xenorhabdus]
MYKRFIYRFMAKTEQKTQLAQAVKETEAMEPVGGRASTLRFRVMLLLFFPYFLTGCVDKNETNELTTIAQAILPEQSVTDYRVKDCAVIWDLTKPTAMENGLYWLRFIDCADRLSPTEARETAKRFTQVEWYQMFKYNILIDRATFSLVERRKIIESLNRYSPQFPLALRPLIQLWREQQSLKINLAEERNRFQRLQLDSDGKIDRLKEIRARLEYELRSVSRKLENLTDIERQLSSRKQDQSNTLPTGEGDENGTDIPFTKLQPEDKSPANTENLHTGTKSEANSSDAKGAE